MYSIVKLPNRTHQQIWKTAFCHFSQMKMTENHRHYQVDAMLPSRMPLVPRQDNWTWQRCGFNVWKGLNKGIYLPDSNQNKTHRWLTTMNSVRLPQLLHPTLLRFTKHVHHDGHAYTHTHTYPNIWFVHSIFNHTNIQHNCCINCLYVYWFVLFTLYVIILLKLFSQIKKQTKTIVSIHKAGWVGCHSHFIHDYFFSFSPGGVPVSVCGQTDRNHCQWFSQCA